MKKVINNIHKNYPKATNATWWRLPEEVQDIAQDLETVKNRDLSEFKNSSTDKFLRDSDLNSLMMDFKKGSIGQKVSFTKVSGSDPNKNKDVIIPGELEITRSANSGGGIYNIALETNFNGSQSPLSTQWNTQYLDPTNTTWAPLWDIQNRTFDTWRNAIETPEGDPAPPMYVGMPAVMKWDNGDDNPRYWLIMFTHWGVGGDNQYGFAYDRYEILNGVFFEQPSADNTDTLQLIDIVSDGVQITRSYEGGALYNSLFESENNYGVSPANTRWNSEFTDSRTGYSGFNDLSNLESRVYTSFVHALDEQVGNNLPGTDLIMHDLTTDLYHKVVFDDWAQGCGGNGNIGPGGVTSYDTIESGSGYEEGSYYITAVGGSGTGLEVYVYTSGGISVIEDNSSSFGQNYQVGDILTFPYPGVTDVITIEVTEICSMGGFAYTRTVIPQSCGIKFADGTVLNTASVSSSAANYDMVYTKGTLDVNVESDFIQLSDTIVVPPSNGITTYTLSTSGTLVVGDCFEVFGIGGSGSGATATINITGPSDYNLTITDPGTNYEIGDTVDFTCGTANISMDITGINTTIATTYNKYKLKGIANFPNINSTSSVYLIGVISGSDKLAMTSDQTTMKATVSTYDELYSKFGANSYIRNSDSGSIATTTFGAIILDNTLATSSDYFVSIIANSSIAKWESVAYLDIEFIAPAGDNLTFSN
jgi:hypothetical protein